MISVFLADDHPFFLAGLHWILSSEKEIRVAGEAANGFETIEQCQRLHPQILLLDGVMPGPPPYQIILDLKHSHATEGIKVILLAAAKDQGLILEMLPLGICGSILKEEPIHKTIQAIKLVNQGGRWFSEQIMEQIAPAERREKEAGCRVLPALTGREAEIVQLLCKGLSNDQIAARLVVSERTVRFHMENLYRKLDVNSRTEAVIKVLQEGFFQPNLQTHRAVKVT